MKTREAVLGFHYAERTKSQLLLAQRLMDVTSGLSGKEERGARTVLVACLEGIRGDLMTAKSVSPHIQWERALQGLDLVHDKVEFEDFQAATEALSRCISSVTTMSQLTMEILLERGIL